MGDVTDTILNLWVFVFLAVIVWLAVKPAAGLEDKRRDERH